MKRESPPVLHPTPRRIIRNTLYNTAGNWILLGFNFLIIPYIIKRLGVDVYGGAWIIGAMLIAYAGQFDLGIGSSCVKYVAEYSARDEQEKIQSILSTAMLFYAGFAALILLAVVLLGKPFLALAGVPEKLRPDAWFVLVTAALILAGTNIFKPLTAVLTALQRMDITNTVMVSTSAYGVLQTVVILESGFGVRGLILGNLIVQSLSTLWMVVRARRILPGIRLRPASASWGTFRQLWNYGVNLQVSGITQILVFQADKLVALKFFGTTSAAFYEVAVKVASLARSIPLVITSALLPAASAIAARREDLKVEQLFERASGYLVTIGILILGFVFLESHPIVATWMGGAIGEGGTSVASFLIRLLLAGYFLNMVTGAASSVAAGVGRTDLERRSGILTIIVLPVLMALLLISYQLYGIASATSGSLAAGAIVYMVMFSRAFKKPLSGFLRLFWKPLAAGAAGMAAVSLYHALAVSASVSSRMQGILMLGSAFLLYACVFVCVLLLLGAFDEYDRLIVKTFKGKLSLPGRSGA